MKNLVVAFLIACSIGACSSPEKKPPEPHLELGQRLNFVGADPLKTYVVVGYRQLLEDKTEKRWTDQEYIVVSYTNDQGDMKTAPIHRNAILKR